MSSSLLVVSKSTIPNGGVGLFAKEDIPKGTKLWVFDTDTNLFFTKPQYLHIRSLVEGGEGGEMMKLVLESIETHSWYDSESDCLSFLLDDGRNINHSDNPSSISDIFLLPADEQHGLNGVSHSTVAAHDIKKGEEVFEDYSTFDVCPWCPNNLATWQFIHLTEEQKKASISKVKEKDVALTPIVVSKRQMEVFKSSHMDKCAKEGMMKWIETQGRWNEEKQSWLLL
eukprot:TRINITY_DN3385_c0_g1_i1.p1 TRINITY_DN3385_c0_g1~~TRINITY_DN3385_c0_g1_i1.p1  ORF type:complete len:227 (-),score=53.15 TRINITY_DN3385_c0_g1_i1:95-775(-)